MFDGWLYTLILVSYYALVLGVCASILLENRNPHKTVAYFLTLILLPVVGLFIYLLFGQDFRKQKIFSRKAVKDSNLLRKWIDETNLNFSQAEPIARNFLHEKLKIVKLLIKSDNAVLTLRNKVKILNNGEAFFPELFESIQSAKHHVHLEFYIFIDDKIGKRIIELLMQKAHEGVKVRLIYDYVGSRKFSGRSVERLKEAGVEVYPFMPVIFPRFTSKANYRNHRKIVVVDGHTGFVGGLNIADRYTNENPETKYWRDTHLKITGEAVRSLQITFMLSWNFVSGQYPDFSQVYFPDVKLQEYTLTQIAISGPDSDWATIMQGFFMAINSAQKYVYITSPYFIPNNELLTSIVTASLSGVDVKLLIPERADNLIVHSATMSYVKKLLEAGVKVYLYKKGFVHAKSLVVDDLVATVGTANMDYRSFDVNFEINAFLYDPNLAKQLRHDFETDLKNAQALTLLRWEKRRFTKRLIESSSRLIAPIL